jgi:hypothetical protein
MFLLGLGLTFTGHYKRQPKPFDVWEFAVVPSVILAVLLWGYWAIDLDPEYALAVMLLCIVLLGMAAALLGPIAWFAMFLLLLYALRYGAPALDLIGAACVGMLAGGVAGYLTAVLWRWIPPRPE